MTFTETGQVPSGVNPQNEWVNSETFTPDNASWLFLSPAPADFLSNPNPDPAGYLSPCTIACSISRLTSIAQNNVPAGQGYNDDGSYFGTNGDTNYINWMEVGFGDWDSDCVPGAPVCTFDVAPSYSTYYGGTQNYPDDSTSQSAMGPTGYGPNDTGPYESYDGIALPGGGVPDNAGRAAAGSFSEPLRPLLCSSDSHGLCDAETDTWLHNSITCNEPPPEKPLIIRGNATVFAIYQGRELREIATETQTVGGSCPLPKITTSWSPNNPATEYNDPSLP